jgi:hypothetical protein
MMTIGTNYRSGSAIVATTGSGNKADSAMVAIRIDNNYKSRQCQGDHRQQEPTKPRDQVTGPRHQQTESATVAIRENNKSTTIQKVPKPEEIRLLVHWGRQNSTTDKDNDTDKQKATKGR